MATWTVVQEEDGPWVATRDGVTMVTVRSHYDAHEVLSIVEREAGRSMSWRLTDDGFQSVAMLEG